MGKAGSKSSRESTNNYQEIDKYQKCIERRIILIGKTGTGKSTLGNAILGEHFFKSEGVQMKSSTQYCKIGNKMGRYGKDVVVLDTPGLMDTNRKKEKIIEELCKCTLMTAPGPHAVCLVIRADDRFTQENVEALHEFCEFFGPEIYKYLIVVFTHKASMGNDTTLEECLSVLPVEFKEMFFKFGGKKIAIECTADKQELEKQINELFKLIEDIIERNDGGYFSEKMLKAAEEAFRQRIPKIQTHVEKLINVERKMLEDEYQEKTKQFQERENILEKKVQEENDKYEQEKQLKEKEKLEKEAYVTQMKALEINLQKEINSLKEQLNNEKRKLEEEHTLEKRKIDKKEEEDLRANIIKDRQKAREVVQEDTGFLGVAKDLATKGLSAAADYVTSGVFSKVIGGIKSFF